MIYNNFLKVQDQNVSVLNQSCEKTNQNNEKKQYMVMDNNGALKQQKNTDRDTETAKSIKFQEQ